MLRPTFQLALLVFTLLFAQQGALSHGISHQLAQQDQSAPHDTQCELCAAYAHIGSAVGSSDVRLSIDASTKPVEVFYVATFHSTLFAAFAARAPPTLLKT